MTRVVARCSPQGKVILQAYPVLYWYFMVASRRYCALSGHVACDRQYQTRRWSSCGLLRTTSTASTPSFGGQYLHRHTHSFTGNTASLSVAPAVPPMPWPKFHMRAVAIERRTLRHHHPNPSSLFDLPLPHRRRKFGIIHSPQFGHELHVLDAVGLDILAHRTGVEDLITPATFGCEEPPSSLLDRLPAVRFIQGQCDVLVDAFRQPIEVFFRDCCGLQSHSARLERFDERRQNIRNA